MTGHLKQQHLADISKQTTPNVRLPKEKAKLVNVIGDECILYCKLNSYYCKLLARCRRSKFEILDLKELLDDGDKLTVLRRNSTNIIFVGWVNLEIQVEIQILHYQMYHSL